MFGAMHACSRTPPGRYASLSPHAAELQTLPLVMQTVGEMQEIFYDKSAMVSSLEVGIDAASATQKAFLVPLIRSFHSHEWTLQSLRTVARAL